MPARYPGPLLGSLLLVALLSIPGPAAKGGEDGGLPLDELRTFAEVLDRIRSAYVEQVDDRTLLENAIEGMLSRLDPHSSYLDAEAYRSLQEATAGEFGGVGLEVDQHDGLVRVIAPMDSTPAHTAGLLPGDLILRIDDQPVRGMSLNEAVNAMRGAPGTEVHLTIRREDVPDPIELSLTRALIEVPSISHEMLKPGFGYIRIAQFQNRTGDDLMRAVAQLDVDAAPEGLQGLILDLRNNPGGVLQAAVAVTDAFLDSGQIVYTEGRLANAQVSYSASEGDIARDVPLVVLINAGSASAAEIVAGALQDHGRALVVGTPSFGKGSVQTILPLTDERAIKLTTALYYTPRGQSIQAHGIVPDIHVERATVVPTTDLRIRREVDLPRHLHGDPEATEDDSLRTTVDDHQIVEALNILRALHVLGQRARPE